MVAAPGPQLPLGISLAPGATFDAYFPGPNGLAVELLQAMTADAGEQQVFLAAGPGLGKSHLLQATCHAAAGAGLRSAYLPLDGDPGRHPEAVEGLEQLDLAAIDALDAVVGVSAWERALFSLVNRAREVGTRLVFAGRRPPAELALGLADLRSRLTWGPVLQLEPLSEDQKEAALAARAAALGLELPTAVCDYLFRHYPRDLAGQLERLTILDRASLASGRRLTVPFVKQVLDADGRRSGVEQGNEEPLDGH